MRMRWFALILRYCNVETLQKTSRTCQNEQFEFSVCICFMHNSSIFPSEVKKVEGKSGPTTCYIGVWEQRRYSSYCFLTLAVEGLSGQHHALVMLYPLGKNPWNPLYRRLGRPQSWSGCRG
jgi:hypothetical protein